MGVVALRSISVPLDRSSPSPTLNLLCQSLGLNVCLAVIENSMIRTRTPSAASARPGCEPLLLRGATIACLLGVSLVLN